MSRKKKTQPTMRTTDAEPRNLDPVSAIAQDSSAEAPSAEEPPAEEPPAEEKSAEESPARAQIASTIGDFVQSVKTALTGASLPPFRSGCPKCKTQVLVTEQKFPGKRVCRCRECGWRGEMEA